MLTVVNFSHPLTQEQLQQIEAISGAPIGDVRQIPCQFDHMQGFAEQTRALVDAVGLRPEEWQTLPILVNLPTLHVIAAAVVAEIHGRMGYLPAVLRLRPAGNSLPRFEVAEILNLQAVRETARLRR